MDISARKNGSWYIASDDEEMTMLNGDCNSLEKCDES